MVAAKATPPSAVRRKKRSPDHEGSAMTSWWLKLSALTLVTTTALYALYPPESLPALVVKIASALRGLCAASGLCVGLGYYTFSLSFSLLFPHEPCIARQIHFATASSMSYPAYLLLDTAVHVGATAATLLAWRGHLSVLSLALAFLFHRAWSFKHSRGRTCYIRGAEGDEIYGFARPTPPLLWTAMYGSETAALALALAWSWR